MATVRHRTDIPGVTAANGKVETAAEPRVKGAVLYGLTRISLGFVFLWAFLDKAFALGFSTGRDAETGAIDFFGKGEAWLNGGSPTDGVLMFALKGPFKGLYEGLAGQTWVEWVYMLSMLLIGLGLMLGIGSRVAAIGSIIWMGIFYTATAVWPEHNPVIDDHIVYMLVLGILAVVGAGRYLGLGRRWERTSLVQRYPILK